MNQPYYASGFFYNPQNKEVLLHLRDGKASVNPNKWALFGGASEPEDKNPVETFIREIKEELGVIVASGEVQYLADYQTPTGHRRFVYVVSRDLVDSEIKLGEGEGYGWFSLKEAFRIDLTDGARRDLEFFAREKSSD